VRASKLTILVGLLLAVGLVTGACSKKSPTASGTTPPVETSTPEPTSSESEGGTITIGSDEANDHGTKDATGQSSLEVELDDFYFEPTVIKGSPGAQLKLELGNEGSALHNFSLTDQNIDQDVQPDGTADVTVTIPQSGFVEFFCKYHKSRGMVGELTT
jgi:plastocyanin